MEEGIPEEKQKRHFTLLQGKGIKKEQLLTDEEWKILLRQYLIKLVK